MTQEDKELLLQDLCARLPYGVKGILTYDESNTTFTIEGIDNIVLHLSDAEECYVDDFKPYLRPMSSMTEEEKEKFINLRYKIELGVKIDLSIYNYLNFLYSHHIDVDNRLLNKKLAIEAPERMYKHFGDMDVVVTSVEHKDKL